MAGPLAGSREAFGDNLLVDGFDGVFCWMKEREPELYGVHRMAVATLGPDGHLHTFCRSGDGGDVLNNYQAPLAEVPSLANLGDANKFRVVDDVLEFPWASEHALRVAKAGFRSSLTVPLKEKAGRLKGFLFFNSRRPDFFSSHVLKLLWPFVQMAGLAALRKLDQADTLNAAIETMRRLSHHRDGETGGHLERMSVYTRLLARETAGVFKLSDEFIEFLVRYAPMHDVGKIAIPDSILLKPERLDPEEMREMCTHVSKGRTIVEKMLADFNITDDESIHILTNIVSCHHENWDGTGYLNGLAGTRIPVEASIIKVADMFDALTSERPYKQAWPLDEAFCYLASQRGRQCHPAIIDALLAQRDKIEAIQKRFILG